MVYKAFLTTVIRLLEEKLGDDYTLSIRPVQKNNGVTLDGLSVSAPDSSLSPTIFMNPYFTRYKQGATMDFILQDILNLIYHNPTPDFVNDEMFQNFDILKSKVMFRIIHTASNTDLLKQIPHIPFMDLSIVFFLSLNQNEDGQMTALIYNNHLDNWAKTPDDLWKLARKNTPIAYPPKISSMSNIMKEIAQKNLGVDYDEEAIDNMLSGDDNANMLFVLSNKNGLYGSACILYKDVLKNFADYLKSDLIILPSSIHEVLITADHGDCSYDELCNMVTNINNQDVPYEDCLSNQVYVYTREDDQLHIVSHGQNLEPLCK